jgi:hypothetical protein
MNRRMRSRTYRNAKSLFRPAPLVACSTAERCGARPGQAPQDGREEGQQGRHGATAAGRAAGIYGGRHTKTAWVGMRAVQASAFPGPGALEGDYPRETLGFHTAISAKTLALRMRLGYDTSVKCFDRNFSTFWLLLGGKESATHSGIGRGMKDSLLKGKQCSSGRQPLLAPLHEAYAHGVSKYSVPPQRKTTSGEGARRPADWH